MGPYVEGHVLSWVIFMPAGTALILLGIGAALRALFGSEGLPGEVWRAIGLGSSALTFLLVSSTLVPEFDPEVFGPQFFEFAPWLPGYGVHYFVAVDGISLFLVLLSTLMVPLVLLASWSHLERSLRSFVFFLLIFESSVLGVFLACNLLLFHLFWQIALVSLYFLIGIWGGPRRIFAATKFLLHTGVGSMSMLAVILVLFRLQLEQGGGPSLNMIAVPGGPSLALLDLAIPLAGEGIAWWQTQTWLFIGFGVAFATPLALIPFHGWLFDAHVEAPSSVSVLLPSLLVAMGGYGLLRYALPLFPDAADELRPLLLLLAVIGVLAGVLGIFLQGDLRKVVAHVSMVQASFVALGAFSLSHIGLVGALVGLLAVALGVGALVLLVGMLEERRGTSQIANFGGLVRPMPIFSVFWTLSVMSCMGLPGLGFFIPEWLALTASFEVSLEVGVLAWLGGMGVVLGLYRVYRRVALGPVVHSENRALVDLDWRERSILLALLIPILWMGLQPNAMLRRVEPAVLELMREMDERRVAGPRLPTPAFPLPFFESMKVGEEP